jgi:peptide/nickel transport system permease protein
MVLSLDLGFSLANYPERVGESIAGAMPWTLGLLGMATLISFAAGTLLGGLLAWPRAPRWLGWFAAPFMVLSAIPYFLIGVILLFLGAIVYRIFPAGGGFPFELTPRADWATVSGILWHATLPALSIVLQGDGSIGQALAAPDLRRRLIDGGFEPLSDTPEQYAASVRLEIDTFSRIIRQHGIKPES